MKRRQLYILILIVSVIGLFAVQYQYLNIGLNLAKVQFQKKIGAAALIIKEDLSTENQLTFLVGKAITLDARYFTLSMDSIQGASRHFLNDFVTHRLTEQGIDKSFTFRLYTKDTTDYLVGPNGVLAVDRPITYPIELKGYLPLLLDKNLILELQFDDLNQYFLFQLNGLTIPTLLFLCGILFVIVWVLRSFYWQSKIITTTNDFINNLTHELKTPVFSIGLATKILEKKVPESQQGVVKLIQTETERLKTHIEKVLELSTLESGRMPYALKPIDLLPDLSALKERYIALAALEGFVFSAELPARPILVRADAHHWQNALNNLFDNAKTYATNPVLHFEVHKTGDNWIFSISDNGPGMTPEQKDLMFEKYYRGVQSEAHHIKGYGLGLSFVQHIVRAHHGSINVVTALGKGTTVSLTLKVYEP